MFFVKLQEGFLDVSLCVGVHSANAVHGPENYIRVDMGGTVGDQVVRWHTTKPVSARSTSGTWRSPGLRKLGLL